MIKVALLATMLTGGAAGVLQAQATPSPALLVLAKRDTSLAIVDPATLKVVGRVPAGPDPHEVVASPDGKLAYVSNYGFGTYNTISVIDLEAARRLTAIDLGPLHGPHGLWFAGGELYFTAEANKVIGRYDPATHKVDWVLGTGQNRTHMVLVSADLNRIFTSNVNSGTISVIEKTTAPAGGFGPPPGGPPRGGPPPSGPGGPPPSGPPGGPGASMPPRPSDWNETAIPVGRGSEGFDVSPDGKELWTGNAGDGTISVIDVAGKKVVATLDANARGANRLKFTLDGRLVLVSTLGGPDLVVFDSASRKEVKRIRLGHGAAGILMQPDGLRAYVACSPDNYVAVVDLKTLEVIGRIEPGREPDGLAWAVRKD
ncbi:MAG TPA: cytochrome D1 domain-containing protein [Terriglobia bacterium]|nr:cytochrome D1 domain-containing protein [Terriglobia bacterium]